MREVKRVLEQDGLLLPSAPDKQTNTNERHFGRGRVYWQWTVSGGFVFQDRRQTTGASLERARFPLTDPGLGAGPPTTRSVIAVCADIEAPGHEERAYLLLDHHRRVFDECKERAEGLVLARADGTVDARGRGAGLRGHHEGETDLGPRVSPPPRQCGPWQYPRHKNKG